MAKLTSCFAAEFELYVKLMGGHMIYLADSMRWSVAFPRQDGRVVTVSIDEGTPLDEARAILADAYAMTTDGV